MQLNIRSNYRERLIRKSVGTLTKAAIISVIAATAFMAKSSIIDFTTQKLSSIGDFYAASIASIESPYVPKKIYVSPLEQFHPLQRVLEQHQIQGAPDPIKENTAPYFGLFSPNHDTNYKLTVGGVQDPILAFKIGKQTFEFEPEQNNIDLYNILDLAMRDPDQKITVMLKDKNGKIQASVRQKARTLLDITQETKEKVRQYRQKVEQADNWNKVEVAEPITQEESLEDLINTLPEGVTVVEPETRIQDGLLRDIKVPIQVTIDSITTVHYDKLDTNLGYISSVHVRRDWKLTKEQRETFEKIVNKYTQRGPTEQKDLARMYSDNFLIQNVIEMYTQMNTRERQKLAPMLKCNILEFTTDIAECGPKHKNVDAALMDYYAFPQKTIQDIATEHDMSDSTIYRNRKQLNLPGRRLLEKIARVYKKTTGESIANYIPFIQRSMIAA